MHEGRAERELRRAHKANLKIARMREQAAVTLQAAANRGAGGASGAVQPLSTVQQRPRMASSAGGTCMLSMPSAAEAARLPTPMDHAAVMKLLQAAFATQEPSATVGAGDAVGSPGFAGQLPVAPGSDASASAAGQTDAQLALTGGLSTVGVRVSSMPSASRRGSSINRAGSIFTGLTGAPSIMMRSDGLPNVRTPLQPLGAVPESSKPSVLTAVSARQVTSASASSINAAESASKPADATLLMQAATDQSFARQLLAQLQTQLVVKAGAAVGSPSMAADAASPAAAMDGDLGVAAKGGLDMMKVIDEERDVEGLVELSMVAHHVAGSGFEGTGSVVGAASRDMQLGTTVAVASAMNQAAGAAADNANLSRMIRDAKRAVQAHEEAAEREKRLADELALDKAAMQAEFNAFRMVSVVARCR